MEQKLSKFEGPSESRILTSVEHGISQECIIKLVVIVKMECAIAAKLYY